jgi:glycerol-3-phosphate acyltransferase PlsY
MPANATVVWMWTFTRSSHILFLSSYRRKHCTVDYADQLMQQGQIVLLAYLLGSTPTAFLVGRRMGVDVRRLGDGNAGSKNVFLHLGLRAGVTVGVVDIIKGALTVWMARWLGASQTGVYLASFVAVRGHDFPAFLGFRGGQGMATALGVLGAMQPFGVGLSVLVTLMVLWRTDDWDCSWVVGLAMIPVGGWLLGWRVQTVWYSVALLPTIGLKKLIDRPRRRSLQEQR